MTEVYSSQDIKTDIAEGGTVAFTAHPMAYVTAVRKDRDSETIMATFELCIDSYVIAEFTYEFDQPQTMHSWTHVDPKRAMSREIDSAILVILALIAREDRNARPIPLRIDGLHRLYKAY